MISRFIMLFLMSALLFLSVEAKQPLGNDDESWFNLPAIENANSSVDQMSVDELKTDSDNMLKSDTDSNQDTKGKEKSYWDLWDKAKQKAKSLVKETLTILDGEDDVIQRELIKEKLDTLEATVKAFERHRLSNPKYYEIKSLHLRLVRELAYCLPTIIIDDVDKDRFKRLTGGYCGASPGNKNWVSVHIHYDEALDYEYTDIVYPFDESNPLPTASSKSDNIADKLLK